MLRKHLTDRRFPEELKNMTVKELELLSYEIRDFLLQNVSRTGGHLASNLGVVELTIAIHKVFNSPADKIIWDVGHQTYIHKILTGRASMLSTLRTLNGLSGFPKRVESPHDCFDTGHSSTSISAAAGFAAARDLQGKDYEVVAVIGDGALTGGLAYEGLNNAGAGERKHKMIVILNDNEMSIGKNTGGISRHLGKLRSSGAYLDFKKQLKKTLKKIPGVGPGLYSGAEHLRDSLRYALVDGALFEELGFKYLGPVDGHRIGDIIEALQQARDFESPVLVHLITKKGKGYRNAEKKPDKFHGIGPFDPATGIPETVSREPDFSGVFGKKLVEMAGRDPRITAVCAAMADGTGLETFRETFPDRFFDAGIAEAHAVTFAAGLAQSGMRPVVAVYSTFLQRAYDQILIDVCLQKLPVIFAVDRAGIVGSDGETHHGIFDLSYFYPMPGLTIFAPRDGRELARMLEEAAALPGPCVIRYPKGSAAELETDRLEGRDVTVLAVGTMAGTAAAACGILREAGIDAGMRTVSRLKPLPEELILEAAESSRLLVTLEDNVITGGFGQQAANLLGEQNLRPPALLGWPDRFIEHGSVKQLYEKYGLDPRGTAERIRKALERTT